jgi:ABC-type multidrug transport system ATPase subunit
MSLPEMPLVRCTDVLASATSHTRDLTGITLEVRRGEIFAVAGPGGSGKSTLLALLAGQVAPIDGAIHVAGAELKTYPKGIGHFTAYVAQRSDAPAHLQVGEFLVTSGRLRGLSRKVARAASQDLLQQSGLAPLARRPLHSLSRGEERLTRVCAALLGAPRLLLLDDPTAGMDLRQRQWLWEMLHGMQQVGDLTVVVATPQMDEIDAHADRMAFLREGQLIALGDLGQLKERFGKGPRMDLRLVPGATITAATRTKLEALGDLVERDATSYLLYPKPDALGSLGRPSASVPVTTMAQALKKSSRPQKKSATPSHPVVEDSWLLDRQINLPGSLGRTVEEIFNVLGPQNIAEFWFAPPTLTDVYLHLTGPEAPHA